MGSDAGKGRPLAGIRVVDLTRVMSGPFCTAMLADLGAEVIKVEPFGGDITRHVGGHMRNGETSMFLALNRGKKSFSVDLRSEDGREAVARLASTADVFIENFRPGVADALGLDADRLRGENAGLVYLSINGYGRDGAMADAPAYDTVIQGQTGMIARQRAGTEVDKVRSFPVDKLTGLFASQAILAALLERERSGVGAVIDVPMFDATVYYLWSDVLTEQTFADGNYTRVSDTWRGKGVYETADDPIVFLAVSLKEHHGVFRAIGRPELAEDERFRTLGACLKYSSERHQIVTDAMRTTSAETAVGALRENGVPATVVLDAPEVVCDEALISSDFFVEWEDQIAGPLRQPRHPVRFERIRNEPPLFASTVGEHTAELLTELGYDAATARQIAGAGTRPSPNKEEEHLANERE